MDKILEVKNLKISFRTSGGTVKAVRDISMDLERGRTIAIVGESGSGKSVTSKAILGILAGNSIIEGGEILYDGKDLLKISEEEMCKIRGDKISMIFQDPLSSLNPIVKIGKQITEAMLLKNKTSRKEAKAEFDALLALVEKSMAAAEGNVNREKELCEEFKKFTLEANKLEVSYNNAHGAVFAVQESVEDVLFRLSKKQKLDVKATLNGYAKHLKGVSDPFLTHGYSEKISSLCGELNSAASAGYKAEDGLVPALEKVLKDTEALVTEITGQKRPDFFSIGFYNLRNTGAKLFEKNVDAANTLAQAYLEENFLKEFLGLLDEGIKHSFLTALEKKKAVLPELEEARKFYATLADKKAALAYAKTLSDKVEATIDRLEINKDSVAYTFRSSLVNGIERYFYYEKHNPKEEARYARQSKRREALIARGKAVDWKVVPKMVFAMEDLQADIIKVIDVMMKRYETYIAEAENVDYRQRSNAIIDTLKDKASKVVYKITPAMAKEKAIKLMEEVGIAEPRMRYNQYPFEFSGGMRQRIVIAIALSADPEILICDEPTTALDVTIQAQILELINRLKAERNLSVVFITHDLGVVANMADDIAVMYAGKIVEYGTADDIFYDPRHPYTWALLSSMPDLDTKEKLDAIPGTPPNMIYPPVGDAFAARNKYAMQIDFEAQPPMFQVSETHKAATWLLHPDAPKVEIPKIITDRIQRMRAKEEAQNG